MRADRLLSILMLLQARGQVTARKLAEELEVSERTIYRDLDALSAAGVPVYAERGRNGGCALLDSYRTTLTGLTRDEVRALFMLSIPAPLDELGVGHELQAALLKLSAALPATRRSDEAQVRQRIHLDPVGWSETREPVPHLGTVQRAVWADRKLRLTYSLPFDTRPEWVVEPYGLVAKTSIWYLVGARDGHVGVYRLWQVLEAAILDETFVRPADFDLAAFWGAWCAAMEGRRPSYPVALRVAPALVPFLPRLVGDAVRDRIEGNGLADVEGWIRMTLVFETFEAARDRILGLGGAAEILEPLALRNSVLDYARQIVALYDR